MAWPALEMTSRGVGFLTSLSALQRLKVWTPYMYHRDISCGNEALEALARLPSLQELDLIGVSLCSESRLSALEALSLKRLHLPRQYRDWPELLAPRLRGPVLNACAHLDWDC